MSNLRNIAGYNGKYKVSSDGRIISENYRMTGESRELKTWTGKDGYYRVNLNKDGNKEKFLVHRLVAEHFCPGKTKGKNEVNHKNLDKSDNRSSNLEWCDRSYNMSHLHDSGKYSMPTIGSNHHKSKLTENDVLQIRSIYRNNWFSYRELADAYNVSKHTIYTIINQINWTHI